MARVSFKFSSNQWLVATSLALLASSCSGGRTPLEERSGFAGSFEWVDSLPPDAGWAGSGAGEAGQGGASSQGGGVNDFGGAAGTLADAGNGPTDAGNGSAGAVAEADSGVVLVNLLPNAGFEEGHAGWSTFGPSGTALVDAEENPHGGDKCLVVRDRTLSSSGPLLDITSLLDSTTRYELSAWVRIPSGAARASINVRVRCTDAPTSYVWVAGSDVNDDWAELRGQFTLPSCTLSSLSVIVDGPPADVDLHVDDVGFSAVVE